MLLSNTESNIVEVIGLYSVVEQEGDNPLVPLTIAQIDHAKGFHPLRSVTTTAATSPDIAFRNIEKTYTRGLPWFHQLPEFKVPKGDKKIALVGGGPSLKFHLEDLKNGDYDSIIACGSVHDYLVGKGIIADYCTACDPDPITADYIKYPMYNTKYLIATACDDKVFERLKDHDVFVWNCYSDEHAKKFLEIDPNMQAIGGGCTVGLRSISIAIMLGYNQIHFYGFDSCFNDEEHHSYEFNDDEVERPQMGGIYEIKLGNEYGPSEKLYKVAGYQLAQAKQFLSFYEQYGDVFRPTFYGTGLLPDLWLSMVKDYEKQTGVII